MADRPAKRPAFCLACGWKGQRAEGGPTAPCPKCSSAAVVLAGVEIPVPRDPVLIARLLDAEPALFWRVMRALSSRTLVGPWRGIGDGDWERSTFDGPRIAWIWVELGGFNWETREGRGSCGSLLLAMVDADGALEERATEGLRLVDPIRSGRS